MNVGGCCLTRRRLTVCTARSKFPACIGGRKNHRAGCAPVLIRQRLSPHAAFETRLIAVSMDWHSRDSDRLVPYTGATFRPPISIGTRHRSFLRTFFRIASGLKCDDSPRLLFQTLMNASVLSRGSLRTFLLTLSSRYAGQRDDTASEVGILLTLLGDDIRYPVETIR